MKVQLSSKECVHILYALKHRFSKWVPWAPTRGSVTYRCILVDFVFAKWLRPWTKVHDLNALHYAPGSIEVCTAHGRSWPACLRVALDVTEPHTHLLVQKKGPSLTVACTLHGNKFLFMPWLFWTRCNINAAEMTGQ